MSIQCCKTCCHAGEIVISDGAMPFIAPHYLSMRHYVYIRVTSVFTYVLESTTHWWLISRMLTLSVDASVRVYKMPARLAHLVHVCRYAVFFRCRTPHPLLVRLQVGAHVSLNCLYYPLEKWM